MLISERPKALIFKKSISTYAGEIILNVGLPLISNVIYELLHLPKHSTTAMIYNKFTKLHAFTEAILRFLRSLLLLCFNYRLLVIST